MTKRNKDDILVYNEPHPSGGNCTVEMTVQQAIDWTRKIHPNISDEDALHDFIIIHWAYDKT